MKLGLGQAASRLRRVQALLDESVRAAEVRTECERMAAIALELAAEAEGVRKQSAPELDEVKAAIAAALTGVPGAGAMAPEEAREAISAFVRSLTSTLPDDVVRVWLERLKARNARPEDAP